MKERKVFGGLFLIFLGTLFLLNNLGVIGWDIWLAFVSFWPLILVAVGIRLIFRNHVIAQIAAFLLIMVVPLVYYLGYGPSFFPGSPWMPSSMGHYETHNWSQDDDPQMKKARLNLDFGAGKLLVGPTDKLVELQAATYSGRPEIKVERRNSEGQFKIRQNSFPFKMPMMMNRRGGWNEDWNVLLGKGAVWDLDINTGAVKAEFNLREVKFSRLDVDAGAGDVRFFLGDTGVNGEIDLDSGAGNVTLVIPANVGVKAKLSAGIGSKNISGRNWEQNDNTYTSSNYQQAATKFQISVDHGAGNVNIVTE